MLMVVVVVVIDDGSQHLLSMYKDLAGVNSFHAHSNLKVKGKVKSLSPVRLFATPWAVACQAPPSMGFSRQE